MDLIENLKVWLKGRKTHGLCAIGLMLFAAANLGWIELPKEELSNLSNGLIFAALAAIRAGVK